MAKQVGQGHGSDLGSIGELYRAMMLIRLFECQAIDLHGAGLIPGPVHPSIGQEGVAVGVSAALRPEDKITSTHRGHGHALAKGADPGRMLAELMGRVDGYCRGKGGSMHLVAQDVGLIGSNGIVAAGMPLAAGAALASLLEEGSDLVVVGYFGDGSVTEGLFHETMNLSSLWNLPVVWVCETNSSGAEEVLGGGGIAALSRAHRIPYERVDGTDVLAVRDVASQVVSETRGGNGPRLIEAMTTRRTRHAQWRGPHVPSSELGTWDDDPIRRLRERLAAMGGGNRVVEAGEESAAEAIARATEFALASPQPPLGHACQDVFGGGAGIEGT